MGNHVLVLLISLVITIAWSVFWGCMTNKIIENKGYAENWFWWGFFFGLIAFIIACTKPECHSFYMEKPSHLTNLSRENDPEWEASMINSNGWKCRRCKRVNASYVGTCSCGNTKAANSQSNTAAKPQATVQKPANNTSEEKDNIQKVRQYKQLLDEGIISHEEYEKKRKELLDL